MRSTANINGHPIHPMLIPFPVAFITGAFVFDIVAWLTGQPELAAAVRHLALAGFLTGLLAAVPGLIDYRYTVPPKSSGRVRATRHAIVNTSALLLVLLAWLTRDDGAATPRVMTLLLEAGATLLVGVGGWMGGVLVSRNQISVDHRYANAGKWKEAYVSAGSDAAAAVADTDDLQVNQMKLVHADARRIVIARDDRGFVAFDDRCPHRGGSLAGGVMICGVVQCPWHGSQFDVRSGAVEAGPAKRAIGIFDVEVKDHQVRLVF